MDREIAYSVKLLQVRTERSRRFWLESKSSANDLCNLREARSAPNAPALDERWWKCDMRLKDGVERVECNGGCHDSLHRRFELPLKGCGLGILVSSRPRSLPVGTGGGGAGEMP